MQLPEANHKSHCNATLSKREISNIKSQIMKKETWKTIIQLIVSILTAMLTAMGTTTCMGYGPITL